MISVYDIGNEDFEQNGNAVLVPTKCRVKQVAGGKYDLTMEHPMDPWGKWEHLTPEAIIKAPIPEEVIENAMEGLEADVYVTNTTATMYEGPHAPTPITYQEWYYQYIYQVGSRVRCSNWSHKNYQCKAFDETSEMVSVPPYNNPDWWTPIADYTSGDPVVGTFPTGTEIFFLEDAGSGWYLMTTNYGLSGYMLASQLTYSHHMSAAETGPRILRDQLFRIRSVTRDTKQNKVNVNAEHVSYDLAGVLVEGVKLSRVLPAMAIAWMRNGFMMEYRGMIATNLVDDDAGTYTGTINGKNAVYALMDPDQGIVGQFDAAFKRDNWDLYVLKKAVTNRGFRLIYGKNMLGVSWALKTDQLVTRVVPVAKDADGNDFFLDNNGVRWVDSANINSYPVIRMEWLKVNGQVGKDDGTESGVNWTEATLREEMEAKAQARFDVDHADQAVHEITIDFERLGDTDEYSEMKQMERVLLYDTVYARNEKLGLDVTVTVDELEYDCIKEKVVALKLSNVQQVGRSVSGFNVVNRSITPVKLTDDAVTELAGLAAGQANQGVNRKKDLQTPVADPSADGTGITFIDTISQNSQGVISPHKRTVRTMGGASASAAGTSGLVPAPAAGNQEAYLRGDGTWQTPPGGGYTLPLAANGTRGGVQVGYTQSGKNYPVQLSGEKMYVNVPWSDTTYSTMTGAGASAAGTSGLVPAPAAGNQDRFLRGDATWAEAFAPYGNADDCDTLAEPGLYRINGSSTLNRPFGWGNLLHLVTSNGVKTQIAVEQINHNLYFRTYENDAWSAWQKVVRSDDVYNGLDQTAGGYALDARQGATLYSSVQNLQAQKANLSNFTQNATATTLAGLQTRLLEVWEQMTDGHVWTGVAYPNFTDITKGFNGSRGYIIYSRQTTGNYIAYIFLGIDEIICDYYYDSAHHWTHGNVNNKADGSHTTWGTSASLYCPKRHALILINNNVQVQVWIPDDETPYVHVGVQYFGSGTLTGFVKSSDTGSVSFSPDNSAGALYTVSRSGYSVTITKNDANNSTISMYA